MRKPPRIAVFLAVLAAVAVWVVLDDGAEKPAPGAAREPAARERPQAGPASSDFTAELPSRAPLQRSSKDPFSRHSWIPAAKRAEPAPAPVVSVPTAPPLPYRYVGEFVLPTGTQVFLARGDNTFRVSEGETLDGEYRIQSLKPGEMVFIHLASGQQQTMRFSLPGEDSDAAAQAILRSVRASPRPAAAQQPVPPVVAAAPAAQDGAAAVPARIRWEGPSSAKAGANFNVALRMTSSGEPIRSAPMEVRFDPKLLEPVSVRPGRYFGANGAANFGYRINGDGSIYIGVSRQDSSQTAAPGTDAELLVLTFKPIKAGTSAELSVAALNLQGAAGRPIAYTALTAFKTTITP